MIHYLKYSLCDGDMSRCRAVWCPRLNLLSCVCQPAFWCVNVYVSVCFVILTLTNVWYRQWKQTILHWEANIAESLRQARSYTQANNKKSQIDLLIPPPFFFCFPPSLLPLALNLFSPSPFPHPLNSRPPLSPPRYHILKLVIVLCHLHLHHLLSIYIIYSVSMPSLCLRTLAFSVDGRKTWISIVAEPWSPHTHGDHYSRLLFPSPGWLSACG